MRAGTTSKIATAVFGATTLLLSLVFTPARSAEKPHVLYVTVPNPLTSVSQLVAFSLEAKTMRVIGNIGYPLSAALAFCPPGGKAYTVTNIFSPSPQLATLNLGTGVSELVGSPLPLGQDIMGLVCSGDGTLYAIGESDYTNPDYNSLYIVNRANRVLARIGSTGVNDDTGDDMFMALRFAPDGTLYVANPFALFTIDLKTGFATKVVDFSANVAGNVMGLAIDDERNFYVADFASPRSSVYALDTSTGVATPILDTGWRSSTALPSELRDREWLRPESLILGSENCLSGTARAQPAEERQQRTVVEGFHRNPASEVGTIALALGRHNGAGGPVLNGSVSLSCQRRGGVPERERQQSACCSTWSGLRRIVPRFSA